MEAPPPKPHPLKDDPDLRKAYITPWALEDAEPHGCTWPGSFAEAIAAGESLSRPNSQVRRASTRLAARPCARRVRGMRLGGQQECCLRDARAASTE
eukprot:5901165-Prymnesium_polylepis.1